MRISDWSSDVCSSDLACCKRHRLRLRIDQRRRIEILRAGKDMKATKITARIPDALQQRRHQRHIHTEGLCATAHLHAGGLQLEVEIGRASGRERVCE